MESGEGFPSTCRVYIYIYIYEDKDGNDGDEALTWSTEPHEFRLFPTPRFWIEMDHGTISRTSVTFSRQGIGQMLTRPNHNLKEPFETSRINCGFLVISFRASHSKHAMLD